MIFILCLILSFFVSSPWNVVLIVVGGVLEVGEVVWGRRLARRWSAKTGVEAMIGREATVVEPCHPNGKIRIDGELWNAECERGADAGETVRILAQRDLVFAVEPVGS